MSSVNFRQYLSKDPKVTALYRGVISSTPNYVHTLVCRSLRKKSFVDRYSKQFDDNGSTHSIEFFYVSRFDRDQKRFDIFNFEVDLGSELIDIGKGEMTFDDPSGIRKALIGIEDCAKYVCQSIAATASQSEDWKLLFLNRPQIVQRGITKPMFFTEDGRVDLEKYWMLISERAYSNCRYKKSSDSSEEIVRGILLD